MGSRSSAASDTTQIAAMADRMWGGVPFTIPSSTAMKYLSGAVKVKRESALAPGGRYNARQTMEREIVGHRFARQDMNDSYENYAKQKMRARTEPKLDPNNEDIQRHRLDRAASRGRLRLRGQKETSAWICWRKAVARVYCWWPWCLIS